MSEDLYVEPDPNKIVRFQAGDTEHINVGDHINNGMIYENWSAARKSEDNTTSDQQKITSACVSSGKRNLLRAAAVILGLLCLLLLTGLIALVLIYTKGISEWKMEMVLAHVRFNNLTKERDQLQTSYINVTKERDQLQTSYINVTKERDQLQTSYINVTKERDQLQTSYINVTKERDQLQTSYNNLTKEQEQLQSRFDNMTKEREDLLRMLREGWRYFSGSFYYMSSEKKSWQDSRDDCKKRSADLVIIDSTEEQQFLRSNGMSPWIGLTDEGSEGTWKWVNGMEVKTEFWAKVQPDNKGADGKDENCAQIDKYFRSIDNWNDRVCSVTLHFICEKMLI